MTNNYYPINEESARLAKQANSYFDYKEGSATAEYRQKVDNAVEIGEQQKKNVDSIHHEKIDRLVNTYARRLAENINNRNIIEYRVPSVMISGAGNFPVRRKQKQNEARDKNSKERREIQGLLDKIQSTGMGGISADDPDVIQKLQSRLEELQKSHETMKATNAYYRKHKTLEGCPNLTPETIKALNEVMAKYKHHTLPFESYTLSNNNASIKRLQDRIEEVNRKNKSEYAGWDFDGGNVKVNKCDNRLQIFFDSKPDEDVRSELKSNGFRWSPKAGAWQRQLTNNALHSAKRMKCIQPTERALKCL
jgi:hypothetical protein